MWAINTGIVGNPEWYTSLTPTSSFEEFQVCGPSFPIRSNSSCDVPTH